MTNHSRFFSAFRADLIFQFKHGFYQVYIVLSLAYIVILSFLKAQVVRVVVPIVIFLDPTVLGMFFIGGMLLLEKQQGVLALLYVTPLRIGEYILSKVISLSLISLIAGVAITLAAYHDAVNWWLLIGGTLLISVFFTMYGMLTARNAKTVNDYIMRVLPTMALTAIPCLSLIPNSFLPAFLKYVFALLPPVAGLNLLLGAYFPYDLPVMLLSTGSLLVFDILLSIKVIGVFNKNVMMTE